MRLAAVVIGFLSVLASGTPLKTMKAPPVPCEGSKEIVEPCFDVHGIFRIANGNPSFRIYPTQTRRVIGVTDITLCPLTKERPGWMRRVCIESVSNVKALSW
jgi:hypothetical protein